MNIGRIAHAGLVVTTERNRVFMDPILVEPFACGTNRFWPQIEVDVKAAADSCRAIVISHHHPDHFSVASLALLPRQAPVYFPRGDGTMENALRRLRFMELRPLIPYESHQLRDLELMATPSKVPFHEVGICFRSPEASCWNMVDTVLDEDSISAVKHKVGPITVLIPQYQPLIQNFNEFPLGNDFPAAEYGRLLAHVVDVAPRWVLPGACGFSYSTEWLNDFGFPVTEAQFMADLSTLAPDVAGLHLRPGDSLSVASGAVTKGGLNFVKLKTEASRQDYSWSPTRGIPPLVDDDPFEYGDELLKREVPRYLDGTFLEVLRGPGQVVWRQSMARRQLLWRLEVVYPGGSKESRVLDFTGDVLAWQDDSGQFAKIHTSCTASMILGVLRSDLDGYGPMFGMLRWARRLYLPTSAGVAVRRGERDEPLTRILLEEAFPRQVDRALRKLNL